MDVVLLVNLNVGGKISWRWIGPAKLQAQASEQSRLVAACGERSKPRAERNEAEERGWTVSVTTPIHRCNWWSDGHVGGSHTVILSARHSRWSEIRVAATGDQSAVGADQLGVGDSKTHTTGQYARLMHLDDKLWQLEIKKFKSNIMQKPGNFCLWQTRVVRKIFWFCFVVVVHILVYSYQSNSKHNKHISTYSFLIPTCDWLYIGYKRFINQQRTMYSLRLLISV